MMGSPSKYTLAPRAVPTSRVKSRSSSSALTSQPSSPGLQEVKKPLLILYRLSPRNSIVSACPRAETGFWPVFGSGVKVKSGFSNTPVASLIEYLSEGPFKVSPLR